ncbi:hypothetical protein ADL28_05805 [Streptomyces violaceusniger]|uniref:Uncharacterized protein n=1 Tax=Streptomyces violaceusniger TaxID=68280 RepID=A0A0X3XBH8_STRVO|nr:hypothetical protein ADL28_05805 [Streptomyces violaceusniger]
MVERGGEELAEHAVRGRRGGGDDEDVALGALLDRGVDHQVVAGPAQRRDHGARYAHVPLDGAQTRAEASGAAHGLVHRGHAIPPQGVHVLGPGAWRIGDDRTGRPCGSGRVARVTVRHR